MESDSQPCPPSTRPDTDDTANSWPLRPPPSTPLLRRPGKEAAPSSVTLLRHPPNSIKVSAVLRHRLKPPIHGAHHVQPLRIHLVAAAIHPRDNSINIAIHVIEPAQPAALRCRKQRELSWMRDLLITQAHNV